jgi:hypothetical protein
MNILLMVCFDVVSLFCSAIVSCCSVLVPFIRCCLRNDFVDGIRCCFNLCFCIVLSLKDNFLVDCYCDIVVLFCFIFVLFIISFRLLTTMVGVVLLFINPLRIVDCFSNVIFYCLHQFGLMLMIYHF